MFDYKTQFNNLLVHLTSQPFNMKFTVGEGIGSLLFLDTEIKINCDTFESRGHSLVHESTEKSVLSCKLCAFY